MSVPPSRFDRFTARFQHLAGDLAAGVSRRRLLLGLTLGAAATTAPRFGEVAAAKRDRCRPNGSGCRTAGKDCRAKYCLNGRFTVHAIWSTGSDHDTYFFVPKESGSTDPAPYIDYDCTVADSDCDASYPFACASGDAEGPGNEVTTVYTMLDGTYQYRIELESEVRAKDLTIKLRRQNGRLVRTWTSPANQSPNQVGWHVFNVNGTTGRVTSVDRKLPQVLPGSSTDICPYN